MPNPSTKEVLVHCGDVTNTGELSILKDYAHWVGEQGYTHNILVAGNHDWCFFGDKRDEAIEILRHHNIHYLEDDSIIIEEKVFYGMPWTPTFYNWAFMKDRGEEMQEKTSLIPNHVDVLISHGPPQGILDLVNGENVGCKDLLERVLEVEPTLHAFGHIHGYELGSANIGSILFVNASFLNENYVPKAGSLVQSVKIKI